MSILRTSCG